ncbi:hypothetical protein C8Q72DRAFT_383681 [Fomitopsis betulina]|nr:hypothetical protein C8Q72DRAFT_383681 [Fomitopsis betulina]
MLSIFLFLLSALHRPLSVQPQATVPCFPDHTRATAKRLRLPSHAVHRTTPTRIRIRDAAPSPNAHRNAGWLQTTRTGTKGDNVASLHWF